jgi:hypothetical protein
VIKKMKEDKCWQGSGAKGTLAHCWWEYKLGQPLWKAATIPQNTKIRFTL